MGAFATLLRAILALILFVLLFGFAAKNTEPVILNFYFDTRLEAPLVLLVLGFFAAGAVAGLLAALPALVRARRALARTRVTPAVTAVPSPLQPPVDAL